MKQYNITVIVGSNTSNSNTSRICNRVFSKLKKLSENDGIMNISIFISSYKDMEILTCNGCNVCFQQGVCPLDRCDNLLKIKEELILSDVIVFASPIYVNFISGAMKVIIDRISYWMHTMYLANKEGYIIVNTNNSGLEETSNYLEYIMTQFGICVNDIFKYRFFDKDEKALEDYTNMIAEKIYQNLLYKKKNTNEKLQECFEWKKKIYGKMVNMEIANYEIDFWKTNEINNIDTFFEFAQKIRR